MRNAHRHRPSDVKKRRWLDRFKKGMRLAYAAADDATKARLEHYTNRTPHLNGTDAKERTELVGTLSAIILGQFFLQCFSISCILV